MHSSRMRTIPCSGCHLGGAGVCWGGVCLWGYLLIGCLPMGLSAQGLSVRAPPMDRMTDPCKTLPCRNYVADGNKI